MDFFGILLSVFIQSIFWRFGQGMLSSISEMRERTAGYVAGFLMIVVQIYPLEKLTLDRFIATTIFFFIAIGAPLVQSFIKKRELSTKERKNKLTAKKRKETLEKKTTGADIQERLDELRSDIISSTNDTPLFSPLLQVVNKLVQETAPRLLERRASLLKGLADVEKKRKKSDKADQKTLDQKIESLHARIHRIEADLDQIDTVLLEASLHVVDIQDALKAGDATDTKLNQLTQQFRDVQEAIQVGVDAATKDEADPPNLLQEPIHEPPFSFRGIPREMVKK